MFRFHHHSHLWVASTRHHESESILINYPFRALSSWPKVISFPFRAQSSRPRVIFLIYDPESFLAFIALSSWPRVIYPIFNPESFIQFPTQSRLSYFWPKVIHLVHHIELFTSFMTLSHPFHLFPSLCYSSHTFLSLLPFPHIELFHPCYCSPMFRPYSRHVLRQNLWSFFSSSI